MLTSVLGLDEVPLHGSISDPSDIAPCKAMVIIMTKLLLIEEGPWVPLLLIGEFRDVCGNEWVCLRQGFLDLVHSSPCTSGC